MKNKDEGIYMNQRDVLMAVLEYHYQENLTRLLPRIENGKFNDPYKRPVKIGTYESNGIKPCFIVINGTHFKKDIRDQRLLKDPSIMEEAPITDNKALISYLQSDRNRDGAYVLEDFQNIVRLGIIEPVVSEGVDLTDIYPSTFLTTEDGPDVSLNEVGGRAQAAAGICKKFSYVSQCMIKCTAVNETATGVIAYLGPEGLEEEIFFKYAPELKNSTWRVNGRTQNYQFIDEKKSIIGVHRKYMKVNGEFIIEAESYIGRTHDGRFVFQPATQTGYKTLDDSFTPIIIPEPDQTSVRDIKRLEAVVSTTGGGVYR